MTAFTRRLTALTLTATASALLAAGALAPAVIAQGTAPMAQTGQLVA